jgi:hypothetical protein
VVGLLELLLLMLLFGRLWRILGKDRVLATALLFAPLGQGLPFVCHGNLFVGVGVGWVDEGVRRLAWESALCRVRFSGLDVKVALFMRKLGKKGSERE